jgi:putative nicotinate phosphoribosyltransferase
VPPVASPSLATDLYQLTMAAGYFHRGFAGHIATCELFVRRLPSARRFLVALGIDAALDYLEGLRFSEDDLRFLATVPALAGAMTPDFLRYLRDFRFTGDVWAAPTRGRSRSPTSRCCASRAPIIEAQILETFLLSTINHATMVGVQGRARRDGRRGQIGRGVRVAAHAPGGGGRRGARGVRGGLRGDLERGGLCGSASR